MSEVKVNKISPRTNCGTTQLGDAGDTITVTGDLRSDSLKAADGGVIISQSGTNITIGASGDTVSLASGASQTGFGRTGTVDWQTGSIKTATFTAANGEGYFANTSGGAFTMNLPAATAGNIVSVVDYTNTFQTNALTITPNGSQKIGGVNASFSSNVEGQSLTFVYVDDTEGWKNIQDSTTAAVGATFICASVSGSCNTLTNAPCGNYKLATFKGPGTFTVNSVSTCAPNNNVDYIVVAGGGAGGGDNGGGAGAGGVRFAATTLTMPPSAPAFPRAGGSAITVTATGFPITVGGGASVSPPGQGGRGSNSVFSTITSTGGGGGGDDARPAPSGCGPGGSGGGGGQNADGKPGNTPPVSPSQGSNGGSTSSNPGGGSGGGGMMANGSTNSGDTGGAGGVGGGFPTDLIGCNGVPSGGFRFVGGGGGGGNGQPGSAPGGAGGTGGGANGNPGPGNSATANTGGGAGGGSQGGAGGAGGSGIVIIRYKFQ